MILFKYMSFMTANRVIENNSIAFSSLEDLNDPFEGAALCYEATEELTSNVQFNAHFNNLSRKFALLSATRNPLNSLMWSHYGDEHRGVVLGIDANIAGFNDAECCLIPSNYGDVIYTNQIPRDRFPTTSIEKIRDSVTCHSTFMDKDYSLYKNSFLYKSMEWAYEEEIRVVKNISGDERTRYAKNSFENESGKWKKEQFQGRPLFCYQLPKESIKYAFLGAKTYKNISRLNVEQLDYDSCIQSWKDQGVIIKNVCQANDSWNLQVKS